MLSQSWLRQPLRLPSRLFLSCLVAAFAATGASVIVGSAMDGMQAQAQTQTQTQQGKRTATPSQVKRKQVEAEQQQRRWRPADPSFDQDGRPYRNPFPDQCMVDLGYGRWESCNQTTP